MGGIGVALSDNNHLNFSNPAANASLLFTTYSLAIGHKSIQAKNSTDKQRAATTDLSYLALGVPLGEKGGLMFGLLPNSTVGYSLVSNIYDVDGEVQDLTLYSGDGGTNKVFLGFGLEVFKGFSIGAQGNYVFGKIENSIINQQRDVTLATKYKTVSNVSGFMLNAGFQYKTTINKKVKLHVGGNFDFKSEIETDGNEYLYSVLLATFELPKDTILNVASKGFLKMPLKTTLGVGVGEDNKWYAGLDYSYQDVLDIQGSVFNSYTKIKYDKYSKIAIGGFYTPKYTSITSYWERVTYRAGLKFEKTGLRVDGLGTGTDFTPIDDFGISFGVGLPMGRKLSNINVGFEIGKRGETSKGLVQENYFNFRLSLTLNDKWFKKLEIF